MYHSHIARSARHAFFATVLMFALGVGTFFAFEPSVGRAITDQFTVTQQITNEISFNVTASDVTMAGSILGMTGGFATGTTRVSVRTNNSTGYNMTLHFATNSVPHAMVASSTSATSSYISNYTVASAGIADFAWVDNTSGGAAEFGYTVRASTTGEVDSTFQNNGTNCTAGPTETDDRCWMNPTTTPERIINSTTANNSSTTTIKFKVAVPSNPSPVLPSGYYTATATLTAVTN